jgi:CubicO group peptidase (beta-lactamase class C family)
MKIKTKRIIFLLIGMSLWVSACAVTPRQQEIKNDRGLPESTVPATAGALRPTAENTPPSAAMPTAIWEWKESSLSQQGLDETYFSKIEPAVQENYPNIYSILVVRHGAIVYEKYFQGQTKDTYIHVFSVTKSVTSALIGIAIQNGDIKAIDQKISEFLPEYFTGQAEPGKKEITIREALTMTAGLQPTDDTFDRWTQSADWFKYAVDQNLEKTPGQEFQYNTGLIHLLSGVLTRATGMSTKDFADRFLFGPLGIKNYQWDTDPGGYYGGGHLLYLTPRDMAKFGILYLNQGKWNGQQIIPVNWVIDSTKKQVEANSVDNYGYLWWLFQLKDSLKGKNYAAFSARGYGSQHIIVVPELDLVVTITSNYMSRSNDGSDPSSIVSKYIIPAVK